MNNTDVVVTVLDINDEINAVRATAKPTTASKPSMSVSALKRRVATAAACTVFTVAATLTAAGLQLYTCIRQLDLVDDLETSIRHLQNVADSLSA
jgi:hypothetical protein